MVPRDGDCLQSGACTDTWSGVANFRQIAEIPPAVPAPLPVVAELKRIDPRFEDFAHAVAHDLREPLRTVSMFTEMLVHGTELGEEGKELAGYIVAGVTRIAALFDGLQAFAMHHADEPFTRVDLNEVLAEVRQDLAHAITSNGAIVTGGALPLVQGRKKDLLRLFQNLLMNAIKYRGDAIPIIHVSAEVAGTTCTVEVRDNGVGIPSEHQESVFLPFKRLHGPAMPGVGIGLAICRKAVESMGGNIWVTSSPGGGATFCFTIAAAAEERQQSCGFQHTMTSTARSASG